jgi:hypothetical protein
MLFLSFLGAVICLAIGLVHIYAGDAVWTMTQFYYEQMHGVAMERTEAWDKKRIGTGAAFLTAGLLLLLYGLTQIVTNN